MSHLFSTLPAKVPPVISPQFVTLPVLWKVPPEIFPVLLYTVPLKMPLVIVAAMIFTASLKVPPVIFARD